MLLKLTVVFLIIFQSSLGFAKPKAYFDIDDSFFSSPRLVIDGKEHKYGFWGFSDIPEAVASDPLAKALAQDYVTYRNWGHGLVWTGLVAAIAYAIATDSDDFDGGTYWGIFALGFIPGLVLQVRSQQKLVRSVNQYNGIYSNTQESTSWQITPANKGLGLALRF